MTFEVKTRNAKGGIEYIRIEADDRSALFAELRNRGISAVSVTAVDGKAKPRKAASNAAFVSGTVKGVAALVLVLLIGACVYLIVGKGAPTPVADKPKVEKPKKVVVVSKPDRVEPVLEVVKVEEPKKAIKFWEVDASQTNGFTRMQVKKWLKEHRQPPAYTNTTAITASPPPYAIFKTHCENEIAAYLTMPLGTPVLGSARYTNSQKEAMLAALDAPMIYDQNDTDEQRQLRLAVEETKRDLKKRVAAGEDIVEILTSTRNEFQQLSMYKSQMQTLYHELLRNQDTTVEDVDNFVSAANKMLEEKGVAPLELGVITRRKLQLHKEGKEF